MPRPQLLSLLNFKKHSPELVLSKLYDEQTFYKQFTRILRVAVMKWLLKAHTLLLHRMYSLTALFRNLVDRKLNATSLLETQNDHDTAMMQQAEKEIRHFQTMVCRWSWPMTTVIANWRLLTAKSCGKGVWISCPKPAAAKKSCVVLKVNNKLKTALSSLPGKYIY